MMAASPVMLVRRPTVMYILLKQAKLIPLAVDNVRTFLYSCACAAIVDEITIDDWMYIARLMAYRTCKKERSKLCD